MSHSDNSTFATRALYWYQHKDCYTWVYFVLNQ